MVSIQDYAILSAAVYNDVRLKPNKINVPSIWTNAGSIDNAHGLGFAAAAYKNSSGDIVIAYEGTDLDTTLNAIADGVTDLTSGIGLGSSQIIQAALFYEQVKTANPNANITFTGHSLGGGLASLMSAFFNVSATTFDEAPFLPSAINPIFIGAVETALLAGGYVDSSFNAFVLAAATAVIDPLLAVAALSALVAYRKSNVTDNFVSGEVLTKIRFAINSIYGTDTPIPIGSPTPAIPATTLHSIVLLSALEISNQFEKDTLRLSNLLPALFDSSLYFVDPYNVTDSANNKNDFLTKLLNDQISLGYTNANGLLRQFSSDVAKISNGLAISNDTLDKALIAAVIEDYYYMANGFTKAFFVDAGNGISFNLNDINPTDSTAALKMGVALQSVLGQNSTSLGIGALDYQWYVDGASGVISASTSDALPALMLASNGNAELSGGSGNDVLVAGVGNDTLSGGKGTDTYILNTGDGQDTIIDSDGKGKLYENGAQITGTQLKSTQDGNNTLWSDGGTQYKFTPSNTVFATGIGTLTITSGSDTISINNFDLAKAQSDPTNGYLGINFKKELTIGAGGSAIAPVSQGDQTTDVAIGNTQTFTIYASAISTTDQTVQLALTGSGTYALSTGATQTPFSGSTSVTIAAGEDSATFTLIDLSNKNEADTATLTAKLTDANGTATSNNLTITFDDPADYAITPSTDQPPPPDLVILGDQNPKLDRHGYRQYDGLNNLVTDGTYAPGFDDVIYGSAGNDSISSGDGNDYIFAIQGGNDTITAGDDNKIIFAGTGDNLITVGNGNNIINATYSAGTGNDTVIAGTGVNQILVSNGKNQVIANGGQDVIIAGKGNNQIYANTQVDITTALAARLATASGQKGNLIAVGDGNNLIVGGTGNDAIFTGTGNNTIILGAGKNYFTGGVEITDASTDWTVVPGSTDIFQAVNGSSAPFSAPDNYQGNTFQGVPNGVSNDTIYGGTGDSNYALSNGNNYLDAGGGNDWIQAGVGNNTIFGGIGNDTIWGGGGTNYINTESGDDVVIAQGGNNLIIGGTGNNTIYSSINNADWATSFTSANNYIYGGAGNSLIYGSGGNDTLIGGTGNATVFGGAGNEYIVGGDGNAYIVGGDGNDTIDAGGNGNDTIVAGNGHNSIYGGSGTDIIVGGSGTDFIMAGDGGTVDAPTQLIAGSGTSTLFGGAGVDQLFGGSGSDIMIAGTGTSTLQGGTGTEVMYSSIGNATLIAGSGSDTLYGGGGTDWLQGSSGNTVFVAGSGNETIYGGTGSNTYQFNTEFGNVELGNTKNSDTFQFGAGISPATLSISATTGSDGGAALLIQTSSGGSLIIDGGLDGAISQFSFANGTLLSLKQLMAQASTTPTTITGTNGDLTFSILSGDSLVGGVGNDTLYGYGGNDTIVAGSGSSKLYAAGGNNYMVSGTGADTLIGADGNDTFVVNNVTDVVQEMSSTGNNTIEASVSYVLPDNIQNLTLTGSDNLTATGNSLNDVITANSGNDLLSGGVGNDTLIAGSGNDTLVGGEGNNTLYGGSGLDTFVMAYGMGIDTVFDTSTQGGIVQLDPGLSISDLSATRQGNDLQLRIIGTNESLRIQGYYSNLQTTWTIQDTAGNTSTPQAILDATAALSPVAQAEAEFIGQTKARLISNYLAAPINYGGLVYTLQPDGSFYAQSNNYPAVAIQNESSWITTSYTYTVLNNQTVGSPSVQTLTSAAAATWVPQAQYYHYGDPYNGGYGAEVVGHTSTINQVNTTSDAPVIYADPTSSTNVQDLGYQWFKMSWALNSAYSESIDGYYSYSVYHYAKGDSSNPNETDLGNMLSYTYSNAQLSIKSFYAFGTPIGTPLASPIGVIGALQSPYFLVHDNNEIQTINLGASDHTVYANENTLVSSSSGNDTIYNAGFVYSGTGNDTLMGGGTLIAGTGNNLLEYGLSEQAGTGNDTLIGGNVMIAGSGSDQLYAGTGAATIQIDPNTVSSDLIGGTGDSSAFLNAYYSSLGFTDWQGNYAHANEYYVSPGETYRGGWYTDLQAAVDVINQGYGSSLTAQQLIDQGLMTAYAPLPVLANLTGQTIESLYGIQPSSYYATSGTPVVNLSANDYAPLAPYYAQGLLASHNVVFGQGVLPYDLHLSWGNVVGSISGTSALSNYTTLDITWGAYNQTIQIMIPHADDPLGSGVTQFTFADGTQLNMAQMVAMAPPAPTFDPQMYVFQLGMGDQIISQDVTGISGFKFGPDITVSDLQFVERGTSHLISDGALGDSILINNSNAGNPITYTLLFANGYTGSYTNDGQGDVSVSFNDGFGNDTAANYSPTGVKLSDSWAKADGSSGNDTFNADASSSGSIYLPDGSHQTISNDGVGDIYTQNFDSTGNMISDSGQNADGSSYSDVYIYNADGSMSASGINSDGSYYTFTSNGQGSYNELNYDANGNLTETYTSSNDGQGNIISTDFIASTGEVSGSVAQAGADYSYTYDNTKLGNGITESKVDYTYTDGSTYSTDTISDPNGSYQQSWVKSDGSSASTNYNAVTGEVIGSNTTAGAGYSYTYDNTNLGNGVTESKVDYTYTDGSTYSTDTISDPNGSYQQSWVKSDGSSASTDYNAVTGEVIGSNATAGAGYSYTYDNTNLGNGVTESKVDYTYTDGSTYSTDTVNNPDGSYQQSWSKSDGSSASTDYNATTGEVIGSNTTAGAGYSYTYDNINLGNGVTESKVAYTYTDGSTYSTDTVNNPDGSYQQSWVKSDGSSASTDYNATTGEVIGSNATAGAGYSYTYDNTQLGNSITESKVDYTYTDGSTYSTDTVNNPDGSYQQSWVKSDGSSASTDYNAVTGEVIGSNTTAGAGYSYTYDNTNLGNGATESKVNYTYTDASTYSTDTISDPNGSYQQSWVKSDGSSASTDYNAVTGEVIGSNITAGAGYSYTYDNTKLSDGSSESKVTYTYTDGSTYATDTVSHPDGAYFQSWAKSDGTAASVAVNANGTVIGDSAVAIDGSQTVDASGNHLLMGSAANDSLASQSGNNLLIGGIGNDTITTGSGSNIIAFNQGDGQDSINAVSGQNNTVSLGGHFAYADLALQKNGTDLVLDIGSSDSMTFKGWYAGNSNIVNLQVIASAMSDFNPGSTDILRNSQVETFDFQQIVSAFDQAQTANPSSNPWSVTNTLLDAHLSSNDSAALGGDLANIYGARGNLSGFSVSAAEGQLSSSQFAAAAQTLNPWPTLNTGTAQIR